jgi:hypothetical protein
VIALVLAQEKKNSTFVLHNDPVTPKELLQHSSTCLEQSIGAPANPNSKERRSLAPPSANLICPLVLSRIHIDPTRSAYLIHE